MNPSTRIRKSRITARAVRRAALRHGLTEEKAKRMSILSVAMVESDLPTPYSTALVFIEAYAKHQRFHRLMESM
jgi:hypothetical protein